MLAIKYRLIISCLLLCSIIAAGCFWQNSKHQAELKLPKMYSTQAANMLALPDNARQEMFDSMADGLWSIKTVEEAGSLLPFAFSIPDQTLIGDATLIYVTKSEPYYRQLGIHYEDGINGIRFSAILEPNKPDFREHANKLKDEIEAGINKADKIPSLINIESYPAFALEPGYNLIDGDQVPRIGVVEWWKDGVLYNLYGTRGPDGTSLGELINIAKSVINNKTIIPAGIQLSPQDYPKVVEPQIQPEDMDNEKLELQEYE